MTEWMRYATFSLTIAHNMSHTISTIIVNYNAGQAVAWLGTLCQ